MSTNGHINAPLLAGAPEDTKPAGDIDRDPAHNPASTINSRLAIGPLEPHETRLGHLAHLPATGAKGPKGPTVALQSSFYCGSHVLTNTAHRGAGSNMKLNRNFVTPFLALIFVAVGASGVLMFFHLADGYTEVLHEILGVAFLLFVGFHVTLNWKAMKSHFGKPNFLTAAAVVAILSAGLIAVERAQLPIDLIILDKVVKAPISDSFKVLDIDRAKAATVLSKKGIQLDGAETIEDIWVKNDSSPEEVVEALIYEAR